MATNETQTLLIVSLRALVSAYAQGLKHTMKRINRDEALSAIVNERMRRMFYADDVPAEMQERMEV